MMKRTDIYQSSTTRKDKSCTKAEQYSSYHDRFLKFKTFVLVVGILKNYQMTFYSGRSEQGSVYAVFCSLTPTTLMYRAIAIGTRTCK